MSSEYDRKLFASQASTIDGLREELQRSRQANDLLVFELAGLRPAAEFYHSLQDAVLGEPALHGEWVRFIALLRLFLPKDVPGLTSPLVKSLPITVTEVQHSR